MSLNRVASYARGLTERALNTLAKIMDDDEASKPARVAAAIAILDRGWGKPVQTIAGDPENPVRLIQRIETIIVEPIAPPPY